MKKVLITLCMFIALTIFLSPGFISTVNDLALERQTVERSYSGVQIALQRQYEILPNMASVASAYATHEEKTFREIAEARAGVSAANALKPSDLATNPAAQQQFAAAIAAQSAALVKLQSVVENYPALKANDNFRMLMKEIEGSQNRIAIARKDNQNAVANFNRKVVIFPAKLYASLGGYSELPFFKGDDSAQRAPTLKF